MTDQLSPGLLVASPTLRCPLFHHSLVLLVEHDENGSFGLIVNRAIDLPFAAVLEGMSIETHGATPPDVPVMLGGPVSPETGFLLVERGRDPSLVDDARELDSTIVLSSSASLLRKVACHDEPSRAVLVLGYSGWAPGQLEHEMREGSWIPVDLESDLLFDVPVDERWRLALERLGIDPAHVVARDGAIA